MLDPRHWREFKRPIWSSRQICREIRRPTNCRQSPDRTWIPANGGLVSRSCQVRISLSLSRLILTCILRVSNDVVQSTAEFERQEKKLKSYTEISATLSKVSNSAAASVAPNLAEILLSHAQTQNHIDKGFAAIGNIWQEIFGVVISEVNEIVNASVEDAVDALKTRMERTMNGRDAHSGSDEDTMRMDAVSFPKDPRVPKRGRLADEVDARSQTVKRLKLATWSPVSSSAEPLSHTTISVGDIIHQMKLKLNEQTSSLQHLAKENNEVRALPLETRFLRY